MVFITFPELPLPLLELANNVFRHQMAALKFSSLVQHPDQQLPALCVNKGDLPKINADALAWSLAIQVRPNALSFADPRASEFAFELERHLLFVVGPSDSQHDCLSPLVLTAVSLPSGVQAAAWRSTSCSYGG